MTHSCLQTSYVSLNDVTARTLFRPIVSGQYTNFEEQLHFFITNTRREIRTITLFIYYEHQKRNYEHQTRIKAVRYYLQHYT
jgi:hypothetical protein